VVRRLPMLERETVSWDRENMLLDLLSMLNESLLRHNPDPEPPLDGNTSQKAILISTRLLTVDDTRRELASLVSRIHPSQFGRVMLATDKEGRLPVHHAAKDGHFEVLGLLIRKMNELLEDWGDLMRKYRDSSGKAPGDLAAGKGHINVLKVLCPSETTPMDDCSLLAAAAGAGQLLVVEYLLQRRSMHPDGGEQPGSSGRTTPLGLASAGGFGQVLRALLRCGADVNLTSQGRKTPLYLAVQHKRREVVEILLGGPPLRGPGDSAGEEGRLHRPSTWTSLTHLG